MSSSEGNSSIVLLLLVGLPGSGKTRVANYLKDTLCGTGQTERQYEVIPICYDELVPLSRQIEICTKFVDDDELNWKQSRKSILCGVEYLVKVIMNQTILSPLGEIEDKIKNLACELKKTDNIIIVVDDNMYYKSMRYQYFQLARKYKLGFCQFYICCPLSVAKANNNQRKLRVPEEVINVMASRLEVPDPVANSWENLSLMILYAQNENVAIADAVNIIRAAESNPVCPIDDISDEQESSRIACNASLVHQSDNVLRKLVGKRMKEKRGKKGKDELRKYFEVLNETRQELLVDIKSGMLTIQRMQTGTSDDLEKVLEHFYSCRLQER